jgi:hypothetical protein
MARTGIIGCGMSRSNRDGLRGRPGRCRGDEADYISGATIFVDGGMTLYPGFAHGG